MHKLIDFICDEMDELERKADKEGKLSMAEVQYLDTLAHTKKNLLKSEEMMGDGYSMRGGVYEGTYEGSYGGRSRDRYGRYTSRADGHDGHMMYSRADDMVGELHRLMDKAPNEQTRKEIERLANKLEQM